MADVEGAEAPGRRVEQRPHRRVQGGATEQAEGEHERRAHPRVGVAPPAGQADGHDAVHGEERTHPAEQVAVGGRVLVGEKEQPGRHHQGQQIEGGHAEGDDAGAQ